MSENNKKQERVNEMNDDKKQKIERERERDKIERFNEQYTANKLESNQPAQIFFFIFPFPSSLLVNQTTTVFCAKLNSLLIF